MSEQESNTKPGTQRTRGRPRVPRLTSRPHRLVTFVTDQELKFLTRVVVEEERSMASVVHRIIAAHIAAHTEE